LQKLGKYELLTELGRGAMGVVYKARDPLIGRLVALKTINNNLVEKPGLLERFYREGQSAGKLQHTNIVTIFELGEEKGTPFIAMEYLEGESLEKTIARRPRLPLVLKIGYIVHICLALEYAHKNGVIHRDIKPANVVVTPHGVVKVVDFGIARLIDFSRTHSETMAGTPMYMAPELFRENEADERSDIWAVGVTFYELICRRCPFSKDLHDLIRSITEDEFPLPSSVAPECSSDIEAVIRRMLQKRPAERYRSMEHVLLRLEPIWNRLKSSSAAALAQRARELYDLGELERAQDALRRACQVDASNKPIKSLLERITSEVQRSQSLPRIRPHFGNRKGGSIQPEKERYEEQGVKITSQEFTEAINLTNGGTTFGPDARIADLLQEVDAKPRDDARREQHQLEEDSEWGETDNPDAPKSATDF
jgi:eukaryotic-like serine/threonine-protein kinase